MEGRGSASRAALLELRQEREVVQEGHRFLDEKCVLLAREILRRLATYESERSKLAESELAAHRALGRALGQRGLERLQVHEPPDMTASELTLDAQAFLGLRLPAAELELDGPDPAVFASPAVADCATAFAGMARQAAVVAAQESALLRLLADYRRTERRVHALENLILPELRHGEREMTEVLEENEMEEAIRARLFAGGKGLLR